MPSPTPVGRAPGLLVAAAALVLEAVGLLLLAVLQLVGSGGSSSIRAFGVAYAGYSVLLILVSAGLVRRRRWSRGPTVVSQLIQLPIAWSLSGGSIGRGPTGAFAVALGVLAVLALVGVLLPSSSAALGPPRTPVE